MPRQDLSKRLNRLSLLLASLFGIIIIGSGILKTRHLQDLAEHVQWQPPGFEMDRPKFDLLAYETALRDQPQRYADLNRKAQKLFQEGVVAYSRGEDKLALARLSRACAAEPDWSMARFYLGAARLATGNPVAAVEDLERGVDGGYDPTNGPGGWWLAMARLMAGDATSARSQLVAIGQSNAVQAEQARAILSRLDEIAAAEQDDTPL